MNRDISSQSAANGAVATVGHSITIRGEITGAEDLVIHGQVEGAIHLPENTVVIASQGRVRADVDALIIRVEGELTGNLTASELIVLHASSIVRGDVVAPRISIEEGARLKGRIDTDGADTQITLNGTKSPDHYPHLGA